MKTVVIIAFFCFAATLSYAQKRLISYEDMKYLAENNLFKADTFLLAKGYAIDKSSKKATRKYSIKLQGGESIAIQLRSDGKRNFMELETDDLTQYNMIYNSIAAFLLADSSNNEVQSFKVRELGMIYITTHEKVPYSPINKDYDINLVTDKGITSFN